MRRAVAVFSAYLATSAGTLAFAADGVGADGALPPWLSTLLGSAPSAGILVWYIYYTTAVRNPQIEERYFKERKEAEDRFQIERQESEKRHFDHLSSMIAGHRSDLSEMWKSHNTSNERLSAAIDQLAEEARKNRCGFEKPNA